MSIITHIILKYHAPFYGCTIIYKANHNILSIQIVYHNWSYDKAMMTILVDMFLYSWHYFLKLSLRIKIVGLKSIYISKMTCLDKKTKHRYWDYIRNSEIGGAPGHVNVGGLWGLGHLSGSAENWAMKPPGSLASGQPWESWRLGPHHLINLNRLPLWASVSLWVNSGTAASTRQPTALVKGWHRIYRELRLGYCGAENPVSELVLDDSPHSVKP